MVHDRSFIERRLLELPSTAARGRCTEGWRRELLVGASIDRRFGAAELEMKAPCGRGFSLVELVVLLTIFGMLAAFAVPKFAALDSQARTAAVNGLADGVKSAAALARGLAMAGGNTASITMEGSTVTLLNSFPDASPTGIQRAVNSNNSANGEFAFAAGSGSTTAATWTRVGAHIPASCSVSYTAAAPNGGPTVAVTTTGC
jgi:MSHA pilin protein MshA